MAKNSNWSDEEEQILRAFYGKTNKGKILSLLPNRSWIGIQGHASKLGINRMNYFSELDMEFIKENFMIMTREEIGEHLNRHPQSITIKAKELGLIKKSRWNDDDENFLRNNFGIIGLEEISKKIGKTVSSIYHRIQHLNLQRKTERYSNISDGDLLKNLNSVARKIKRTPLRNELSGFGLPSEIVFSARFGSYGEACLLAGLEINQGMSSGQKHFSKQGHLCLSRAEQKITDFLIDNSICFEKEIPYCEITNDNDCGKMICDWLLHDGTIVEYFGMDRNLKYKNKMDRKIGLCKRNGLNLIKVLDRDINKLEKVFHSYI
jgi:hypothetical protein